MMQWRRALALMAAMVPTLIAWTHPGLARDDGPLRLGVVQFLSGPGANSAGLNAKAGAELMIEAINAGKLPPPYDSAGFGGHQLEAIFIDETGGPGKMVTEFRNMVGRRGVEIVSGYLTSQDCNAVAPVAEELQVLTLFPLCAVPIFERNDYRYVFQTINHATALSIAMARFAAEHYPAAETLAGINPNYAWGRDSWGSFTRSMAMLKPTIEVINDQWPKLFAGQYGAEISTLLNAKPDLLHSSLWGGDQQAFVIQAAPRGLFKRSKVMFSVGLHMLPVLGEILPDGTILSTLGPYGPFADGGGLETWFSQLVMERTGTTPKPPHQAFGEAILALKVAFDKAAGIHGDKPTVEQAISALEYERWEGITGTVDLALGKGHQAILPIGVGLSRYDDELGEVVVTDIARYPAKCINPPPDMISREWIDAGFPGAECD